MTKQIKQKWKSRKKSRKSRDQKYWKIPSRKIPGFGKIPSQKIPGLKFLIPLGPALNPCKVIFLFSFVEFKSPHPSDQISQRLRLARAASCSWQKEMKKCSTTMNLKLGAFIGHPWETFEKSSLSGEAWIQGHLLNCYGQCHIAIYAFQSHPLMYTCVYNVRRFLT